MDSPLSLPCEYPDCKNIIRLFCLPLQKSFQTENWNERECLLYKSQQSHCSGMPAPSIIIITRPRWLQLYFCWADSDWFSSEGGVATEEWGMLGPVSTVSRLGSFVLTVLCSAPPGVIMPYYAIMPMFTAGCLYFVHSHTIWPFTFQYVLLLVNHQKTSNKKYLHNNSFETLENHLTTSDLHILTTVHLPRGSIQWMEHNNFLVNYLIS